MTKEFVSILRRYGLRSWSVKHVLTDAALITASLFVSLFLRTGVERFEDHDWALIKWSFFFVSLRILTNMGFGVYLCIWRYVSTSDAYKLAQSTALSSLFMIAATVLYPRFGLLPRSFFFIDTFVCASLLMGARLLRRRIYEQTDTEKSADALSTFLIYGAGSSGRLFAQRMMSSHNQARVIGFIDDDPIKQGKVVSSVRVLGSGEDLESLFRSLTVTDLIIAIEKPPHELLKKIVLLGRKYNVRPQILSNVESKGFDPKTVSSYRELDLQDLLNRPAIHIDLHQVRNLIEGKCVLVTGAGGSIGSELCRQIDRLNPARILLLDNSEFALYEIDRELRPTSDMKRVVPLLLDIKDKDLLENVFITYKPQAVFHAAAYKHVHLVEANPTPAILNNILGTQNLLDLCVKYNTERFLMVSTDKAVNPVGIMGATKRVCELMTSEAGIKTGRPYSSVRFGNVLGSSGSLVPLLRTQIENGGPVTLTHEDMTRYFMLIPEAVSLVLMSSTLCRPGEINVLRMGAPLKIVDLARSLMALMGRSEDEIPIVFTGVRPGEKMFEELYLTGEEVQTRHSDILTLPPRELEETKQLVRLRFWVDTLVSAARAFSPEATVTLLRLANRQIHDQQSKESLEVFS